MRLVDQYGYATRRQTFPDAYRPGQLDRNIIAPTGPGEGDRLALVGAIVSVRDEIVRDHGSAKKLGDGVLRVRTQRGEPRGVRTLRQGAALGQIRRLLDPATKRHAAPIEPRIHFRDGIGAILGMKERIRHRFGSPEIVSAPQHVRDRMVLWQRVERGGETSEIRRRWVDLEQPAVLLHHIDSGPAIACVDHHAHRAVRSEDIAERAKTFVRVGQVMQHAGANHQIERSTKFGDALDRELMQFEIFKIVLALKIPGVAQARVADVDRRNSRIGLAERIFRGLRSTAASDQDLLVFTWSLVGPYQVELGSATERILVQVDMLVQIGERRRIGHPLVKVADFLAAVHSDTPANPRRTRGPPRASVAINKLPQEPSLGVRPIPLAARGQAWPPWVDTIASTASRLNEAGF